MFLTVDLECEVQHLREDTSAGMDAINSSIHSLEKTLNALLEANKALVKQCNRLEQEIEKLNATKEEKKKKTVSELTQKEEPVSVDQILSEWLNGEEKKNE